MCLEFGSCFGGRRRDDYGRSRGNHGHGYWSEPAPVYQQPPALAVHDGAPKAGHADDGGHGGFAYLQDKAGSETPWHNKAGSETPWHNKVGDDGAYTPRHHEAAADHREHAAMDYHPHQYPTTTTTTLARYQLASR